MGFIPGVLSPQFLKPGRWVYLIPAPGHGIPVEPLTDDPFSIYIQKVM